MTCQLSGVFKPDRMWSTFARMSGAQARSPSGSVSFQGSECMEAIIHPGMPKTGTSSIQLNLVKLQPEGWLVPTEGSGNMSALMAMFFLNEPHKFHGFKARGMTPAKVQEMRDEKFAEFDRKTREAFEKGQTPICTAEVISSSPEDAVERLAQFYVDRGFSPRVVAYVRSPVAFMQSAFQQRLKGTTKHLTAENAPWPDYRDRFEKLDRIFGRENVTLKVFDPSTLHGGDVCLDFFQELGIEVDREKIVRVNESMSLEACALLFAQRHLGQGFVQGFDTAQFSNNKFIATLTTVGKGKLRFKRAFLTRIMERHKADLEWMEERLNQRLWDVPEEDHPDAIGNAEDLLKVADKARDLLENLLMEQIQKDGKKPRDRLLRNLELLRTMHY
jgi:hypothetical protein